MKVEITNQVVKEFMSDLQEFGDLDIEYRVRRALIKHSALQNKDAISILDGLVTDLSNLLNGNDIEWNHAGYFNEAQAMLKARKEVNNG